MSDTVSHAGWVESVEDGCVRVRIRQTSACSACKIAAHCNASESKEKFIDVYGEPAGRWQRGDAVTVTASKSTGWRAVALGFILPFLLMMTVLVAVYVVSGGDEPLSGLLALVSLAPYYAVLWLMRNRLRRQLTFSIRAAQE